MKLTELEAKRLFTQYGIPIPRQAVVTPRTRRSPLPVPLVLKSQVAAGDRGRKGGIIFVTKEKDFLTQARALFAKAIDGLQPEQLLAEERIDFEQEYYISFSFSSDTRTPVLSLSPRGGSGIHRATVVPIDVAAEISEYIWRDALLTARLPLERGLIAVVWSLWRLFSQERLLLAEINPLFRLADGRYVAGDAKIIQDDALVRPGHRPYIDMDGDLAVIASGGGASMVNLDALLRSGGRPANYVEYSGNPKGEIVTNLTRQVLSKPGLRGAWVIGGTANFTDIYETIKGFVEGLRQVRPKPRYPIVVRRDGPRQREAFELLERVRAEEGFDLHLFGPETPMAASAEQLVRLAYGKKKR